MKKTQEPILTQLIKQRIEIDSLTQPGLGSYYEPLIDLIRKSPAICEMAKQPWDYKSLAQYGIEIFCGSSITSWYEPNPNKRSNNNEISIDRAIAYFSECVGQLTWAINHGLRLYVKDESGYRVATLNDDDYKFVARLLEEEHGIHDLRFRSPPKWAQNLYLNSHALEVYEWFYSDYTGDDLQTNARKVAISRMLDDEIDGSIEKTTKPESTRKTENLLRALTCIAIDAYGYDPKSAKNTAAKDIATAMSAHGFDKDERTIRDWLKDGVDLLPPTSNKV